MGGNTRRPSENGQIGAEIGAKFTIPRLLDCKRSNQGNL
jgi:hypothetical protein